MNNITYFIINKKKIVINFCCNKFLLIGDLVSGTECLDYTSVYLQNESISRTRGGVNYKEYSMSAKKPKDIIKLSSVIPIHKQ